MQKNKQKLKEYNQKLSKARRKLENPLKSDFRIYSTDIFAPGGIYRVIVVGDSEKQKEKHKNMKDKQENRRNWKLRPSAVNVHQCAISACSLTVALIDP